MTRIPTLEEMLKAGIHFGHRTSKWHPKMDPFIFTSRNGIHIIDLAKSQMMLAKALEYIKTSISQGKIILFVGTKPQVKKTLKKMCQDVSVPYVAEKWLGGCLTNFSVIKNLVKKYKDLSEQKRQGKLGRYTKKERLEFDREIFKLEMKVGGLANMIKIPDIIFIWDIKTEKTALAEAKKLNIPIIAICDSNVNPDGIDYIIPANDDATKTVKLVLNAIKEAINEGKKNQK